MIGTDRQPTQCTPHREDRGVKDVEPIDLANRGGANADRERAHADLRGESCPRVRRELLGILDADAVGDLSHGERLAHAAAATRNADALERLNALLLTFFHTDVDAQCVTGAEGRNGAEPLFLSLDEGMHMTLGAGRSPRLAAATHRIKSFGKTAKANGDHGRTLASVRACTTWRST